MQKKQDIREIMASSSSNKLAHLVVGGDSMIGAALTAALRASREGVHATTRRAARVDVVRPFLDLATEQGLPADGPSYGVAYLCAAIARINDCFNDPAGSAAVNVANLAALAQRLAAAETGIIFLSSNQVLSGGHPFPDERTAIAPVNVYGDQKAQGEKAIVEIAQRYPEVPVTILRLSKVLPSGMSLFADWAARLRAGQVVVAAADMSLAPIPLRLVVETLRRLANGRHRGLFQLSSAAEINYVDAARHLCRRLGCREDLIQPVQSVAAGFLKETPPRHTIMDSGALTRATGIQPLDPYAALDEAFAELDGDHEEPRHDRG